jgi:hypothetical protein
MQEGANIYPLLMLAPKAIFNWKTEELLGHCNVFKVWGGSGSNRRLRDYESV